MALTIGSVTVDEDGVATGSGEAKALYDILALRAAAKIAESEYEAPPEAVAASLQGVAELATDLATYFVQALTLRAKAAITTGDAGLQRMPASTAENTDTKAPSAQKLLSIV